MDGCQSSFMDCLQQSKMDSNFNLKAYLNFNFEKTRLEMQIIIEHNIWDLHNFLVIGNEKELHLN